MLLFDGSDLGEYEFQDVVKWIYPVNPLGIRIPVMMILFQDSQKMESPFPVYLKRAFQGNRSQALIDELKSLFGLTKMGCHRIRLNGVPRKIVEFDNWISSRGELNFLIGSQWSDYLLFRAETEVMYGKPIFILYSSLQEKNWIPQPEQITPEDRRFFFELQKIFLFRELFRVSDTSLENVLIKSNPSRSSQRIPLSIDEMEIRSLSQNYHWLNVTESRFFFPQSDTKGLILVRMFALDSENYRTILWQLKESISQIVERISPDYVWLSDYVVSRLVNLIELHFKGKFNLN